MATDNPLALLIGCAAVGGAAISVHTHIKCNDVDTRQKVDIQNIYSQLSNMVRDFSLRIETLESKLEKQNRELNKLLKKSSYTAAPELKLISREVKVTEELEEEEEEEEEDETEDAIEALTRKNNSRN